MEVLFGIDAIDSRPQWALMQSSLQLNAPPKTPVARPSVLSAKPRPDAWVTLRVREDGKCRTVQILDVEKPDLVIHCT